MIRERVKRGGIGRVGVMGEGLVREDDRVWGSGGCGWVGVWVCRCECDKQACIVGGCGIWVQVMERVKIDTFSLIMTSCT